MSGLISLLTKSYMPFLLPIIMHKYKCVHLCRLLNLSVWLRVMPRVEDTLYIYIYIWLGLLRPYLLTHEVP